MSQQISFWGNVDYPSNKLALLARNAKAKELRQQGKKVICFTLANQWRKYDGLGQPGSTVGNAYYVQIND
jgi:hypothetical protein